MNIKHEIEGAFKSKGISLEQLLEQNKVSRVNYLSCVTGCYGKKTASMTKALRKKLLKEAIKINESNVIFLKNVLKSEA